MPKAEFYQFVDPEFGTATICVGPNTVVRAVFDERSFVQTFGRYCVYRDTATGVIYLGVWSARLASRFRRLMREGGTEISLRKELPTTFRRGGQKGRDGKNWLTRTATAS